MTFFHRGQTNAQLVTVLHKVVFQPQPHPNRIWLLSSGSECIFTFLVCAIMLYKKKSLGKLWFVTKRDSPYGAFYVTNSVFVLVVGVAVYLIAWDLMALIAAGFSFARSGTFRWWWIIPLPWWPLVVGAYTSIHGFAVGCSPKSPLSTLNHGLTSTAQRWYYLPVPHSPALVNGLLIIPVVLFSISTFALVGKSGHSYYSAEDLRSRIFPDDIWQHVERYARDSTITFEGSDLLASDELIWLSHRVSAAYFEVHRYVSLNLVIFSIAAFLLWVPCVVYGLPNLVSLIDHACSRQSLRAHPSHRDPFRKVFFLLTKGKPTSDDSTTGHSLNTWKMTILAIIYVLILVICVPVFAMVPLFILACSWPHGVARGDIITPISGASIAISMITLCSCSFVAMFCTIATLDPLFRAAIGLNMIRTQI